MFGNSQEGGLSIALADPVKTPPLGVPAPMPNVAMGAMGVPPCVKVMFDATPAHNLGTSIVLTMADEAGAMGGVVSCVIKGPTKALTGAFTVLVCGQAATRITSISLQNGGNTVGVELAPSQLKVMILSS